MGLPCIAVLYSHNRQCRLSASHDIGGSGQTRAAPHLRKYLPRLSFIMLRCWYSGIHRFAQQTGSQACRTCPLGTLAPTEGSQSCQACPSGTYSRIPGAHEEAHCLSDEQHQAILEDQTQMAKAMQKLSPIWRDLTRGSRRDSIRNCLLLQHHCLQFEVVYSFRFGFIGQSTTTTVTLYPSPCVLSSRTYTHGGRWLGAIGGVLGGCGAERSHPVSDLQQISVCVS